MKTNDGIIDGWEKLFCEEYQQPDGDDYMQEGIRMSEIYLHIEALLRLQREATIAECVGIVCRIEILDTKDQLLHALKSLLPLKEI